MADFQIPGKDLLTSVDRAADSFLVYDNSASALKRTVVNNALDLTSHPVGVDDTQTLTLKTLTAPAISSPVLSGTVTGTYTLAGTPTFPAAVVTLTGTQTLTNKTLTSPTITSATITNPTLTVDTVSEFTAANGVTIDGLNIKDGKLNTANSVVSSNITDSAVGNAQLALGVSVQTVYSVFSAVSTGTTTVPLDDTIPQNTEGNEFMTLAITPKSATNILVISFNLIAANSAATYHMIAALFQDTTANAIAASAVYSGTTERTVLVAVEFAMVAGTTSSTTFKVRAGADVAGTTTFNGRVSARLFGAIAKSSMTIREYKAA